MFTGSLYSWRGDVKKTEFTRKLQNNMAQIMAQINLQY